MNGNHKKTRRQFPAETKLQILKEGRTANLSLSQDCEQYQISLRLFYDRGAHRRTGGAGGVAWSAARTEEAASERRSPAGRSVATARSGG